jgi:hypothetical protein
MASACRRHLRGATLRSLCVGLALLFAVPLTAGEETTIDGIPHVRNGDTPPEKTQNLPLRELWRVGGEDDEIFFGTVAQVRGDEEGDIYILDAQLSEVQVYSPAGEYLRTLSREGDGPGEIRGPADMFFFPDGTLGLVQSFPGKVIGITRDGVPAPNLNLNAGQFGVLSLSLCRGGNLVLVGFHMSFDQGRMDQKFFLSSYDREAGERHRYLDKDYAINPAAFVADENGFDFVWSGRVALGPDGSVYTGPDRNAYLIHVYTPAGELQRVIERECAVWKRTDEQLQQARLNLEAIAHYYPYPVQDVTIEKNDAIISGMMVREDGSLWVANSYDNRTLPAGTLASFDVFDPAGHFRKKIRLVGPGDPEKDATFFPRPDRVVVVTGATEAWRTSQAVSSGENAGEGEESGAPLAVICYSIAP